MQSFVLLGVGKVQTEGPPEPLNLSSSSLQNSNQGCSDDEHIGNYQHLISKAASFYKDEWLDWNYRHAANRLCFLGQFNCKSSHFNIPCKNHCEIHLIIIYKTAVWGGDNVFIHMNLYIKLIILLGICVTVMIYLYSVIWRKVGLPLFLGNLTNVQSIDP